MKIVLLFFITCLLNLPEPAAQKSKKNKGKNEEGGPRVMQVYGDSVRTDSVVYYETEIGFIMKDFREEFAGQWKINVMRRQARAVPDSLTDGYLEFYGDSSFSAFVGCNKMNGYCIIKGPTIKFTVTDTLLSPCATDLEAWFIKLIQERVSYFGIDEKILYLKDVAFNIVFDCSRQKE
jgi:heat shock protein HslJ